MPFRKPRAPKAIDQRNARQARATRRAAQRAAKLAIERAAESARAGGRFVAAARTVRYPARPLGYVSDAGLATPALAGKSARTDNRIDDAKRFDPRIIAARRRFNPGLRPQTEAQAAALMRKARAGDAKASPKGGLQGEARGGAQGGPQGSFKATRNTLRARVYADFLAREREAAATEARRRKVTRIRARTVMKPLVLARPVIREGAEDYRQHPSRLTPGQWEAYWAPEKLSA